MTDESAGVPDAPDGSAERGVGRPAGAETGAADPAEAQPITAEPITVEPITVEPIRVNSARIVFVGTALWAVGFLVLAPFYAELGRHHHRVWLWTCLAGVGVGAFAYVLTRRHRSSGRTD